MEVCNGEWWPVIVAFAFGVLIGTLITIGTRRGN